MADSNRKLATELEQTTVIFTPPHRGDPPTECRLVPHWLYDQLLERLGRKRLKDTTHERVA